LAQEAEDEMKNLILIAALVVPAALPNGRQERIRGAANAGGNARVSADRAKGTDRATDKGRGKSKGLKKSKHRKPKSHSRD
jgi:hypothetical protein